ncbi:tail tape measure protein [Shigella phage Sd1]|uniref:Tape measure protein n=1 Tax=Shigella phage Sd1 TaxID=2024313 RepID=A0A291AYP9_9CAUD|nr:tail length tape measure protein [Shigella phage Sd1]ATE86100.1 tail tape measure protein [Shigella phage Sd1]
MAEFAGITLGVDVRQVDQGTKSLQEFKRANEQAAAGVSEFVNAELVAKNQARDTARYLSEQRTAFRQLQTAIDPTAGKLRKLQEAADALDKSFSAGVIPEAEFYRLSEALETQTNRLRNSQRALTEEGRAAIEASKAKAQAATQAERFLKSLQAEAQAATLTREELLKLRAAELGVSSQAAPIIAQIGAAADQSAAALTRQSQALQRSGLSVGQYKNAIRTLPAQITDIGTSLAGGIPIWLIAIQQGGQIKDSFGGVANTFRFALAALNPFVVAAGALGVALGALGLSAYQAYQNTSQLNQTLTLTGQSANLSAGAVQKLARNAAEAAGATQGLGHEIANGLVASGNRTVAQISIITEATARWATVTGDSADDIVKNFDKIANDPVKGLAELDKQFNFLTAGQLKYIEQIRVTEGQTQAVTAATKLFADVMENRLTKVAESLTPLEKAWDSFKNFVSRVWTDIGNRTLGALNLIVDVVAGTIEQIQLLIGQGDVLINNFLISTIKAFQNIPGADGVGSELVQQFEKQNEGIKKANEELVKSVAERDARIRKGELGYVTPTQEEQQRTGESDAEFEKRRKAREQELKDIEEANKKRKQGVKDQRDLTISYESGVLALQAQLKVLQEHRQISDVISNERKQLFAEEAKFAILNERLADGTITKEQRRLLLQQDKILGLAREKAELGDQIVLQERANKLLDDNIKKTRQINAEAASISTGAGLSQREAERRRELAALEAQQVSKGGSVDDTDFQALLQARQNFYNQEDALRGNWLAGVKSAFAETADELANFNQIGSELAMSAFNGLTDQITNLVTTGEANFREFTASILKQIARIATQLLLIKAIESTISSFGGSGGAIGSIASSIGFASGGYTGNGGKYEPAGTVHRGEFVFTKEATSRIGVDNLYKLMRGYANGGIVGSGPGYATGGLVSGSNVNVGGVNVTVQTGLGGGAGNDAKQLESGIRVIIAEEITQSFQQGGTAYQFLRGYS